MLQAPQTQSGNRFFTSHSHNPALPGNVKLMDYFSCFPAFNDLLFLLQQAGYCAPIAACEYSAIDFLKEHPQINRVALESDITVLLTAPHPILPVNQTSLSCLPEPAQNLETKIACYIGLIIDVLNNQLAQKPYEQTCDQENVTEREHALQAGKIAAQVGLPKDLVISLLLHDIARPSVNDAQHGHKNHCGEGSTILAPLGLPVDFAGLHTLAKYLLSLCCKPYNGLISSASRNSLAIQKSSMPSHLKPLLQLESRQLAKLFYQIMFLRLIDDSGKAPESELQKTQQKTQIDYLQNETIASLLTEQIINAISHGLEHSEDKSQWLHNFEEQLDTAITLLGRAREYSNNPELYQQYESVFSVVRNASYPA
ncbi:hypothetical protein ACFORL_05985 [Legionella dresdenensis]|uniref:HD domain-containing protein n=1 Tax=Legionella dresdenensis TaxID=450200 RepID=A0ABV8CEN2_9GAMM